MSKFLKIMIVLLTITAMAAPVVIAEDRLGLGGQMRVRGWHVDDGGDYTDSWLDQRLRIGGKLSVADGVSVTFRTDITEQTWGNGGSEYGSGRMGSGQQWDRAHLDLVMGDWHLRAGQMYAGYSLSQVINSQDAGFKVDYNGPISFSAFWLLDDQDNGEGVSGTSSSDSYLAGANVGHSTDMYSANVFTGLQTKAMSSSEEVYLFGADATFNLEMVKIMAELNFFTGDASSTVDAMGTQGMVDVSMSAAENVTVGGQFFYAAGDTEDAQYVWLGNDFNGWDPISEVGTGLHNEAISLGRPYDFTGQNAGVIAGRLYGLIQANDALGFGASIAYMEPEEDANTDLDSAMVLAAGMSYKLMANTSLDLLLEYIDPDEPNTDETLQGGFGLFVNF